MDREHFDAMTRLFAATPSRRAALGALLGASLAGAIGPMEAKKNDRKRKRRQKQGRAALAAEAADCLNPGPSSNMNECNFNNRDFVGQDLSSSSMRGTRFRGADLCGADLSSSQLKDADFRGFPVGQGSGNPTTLFRADLSSSGCKGTLFNNRTLFCQTKMCNGAVNDRDCPDGVDPEDVCCGDADCPAGHPCVAGVCSPCPEGWIVLENGDCVLPCDSEQVCLASGSPHCGRCRTTPVGQICTTSIFEVNCDSEKRCPRGSICIENTGLGDICIFLCEPPAG